jgi:hypothetical protein
MRFASSPHPTPTDSPLRNSGVTPIGGIWVLDFAGEKRTQGGRIDRGAYEIGEVFANSFE